MGEQRNELLRRMLDAISRQDVPAIVAEVDPGFELMPLITVWPQPYVGHDGIEQWMRDVADLWDEFVIEAEAFRDLDEDTVLIELAWHGRGKGISARLEGAAVAICRFRGEKPVSARLFQDEARALAAFAADA